MNPFNKKTRKAKSMTLACGLIAASLSFGASAHAFSDLKGDPAESKIRALHESGAISGVSADRFAPKSSLTYAQGIQFIVSGMELKRTSPADTKASTYFDKIKDQAWYAPAFITARDNGITLDKGVNPAASLSRAQFAHMLNQAVQSKGNFPVTKMYFEITDGQKLDPGVNNSLQTLLNMRIIKLEEGGKFRPNQPVTRSEAAAMVYDAAQTVKRLTDANGGSETKPSGPVYETAIDVTKAADGVNKVTLTVSNLPNPGYGLKVDRIEFGDDKTAVIFFKVTSPDPSKMYAQVISEGRVTAYVPEWYNKVTAQPVTGSTTEAKPLQ